MSESMKKPGEIKVLLVEDRIDDAELLVAEMRRRGLPVVSLRVESEPAYTHALRHFAPQLILSDYTLPDFDGPLALRIARRERPDTPFIFVSGILRPQLAKLLRRGAVERTGWRDVVLHLKHTAGGIRWLEQSALPLMNDSGNVIGYRGVARDITQRRTQQDRIARLSRIQAV